MNPVSVSVKLVVDDEEMLTGMLYQYFGDYGCMVYTANESEKALKLLKVKPDLILLDVNIIVSIFNV